MNENSDAPQVQPFTFSGTGGEYFRIWIVNLALTILTLGIYSAWAKVRRLQYFYRNTSLMGHGFDYHGDPIAILKGRLIGVALLIAYNGAFLLNIWLGIVIFFVLLGVFPWLLQRSIAFRLHYSSYRGLRFRFSGSVKDAYRVFLAWPLGAYATAGALMPLAHQRIKEYQHANSNYGTAPFTFGGKPSEFYIIYFKVLGMMFVLLLLIPVIIGALALVTPDLFSGFKTKDPEKIGKLVGVIFTAFMVFYLAFFLLVGPWFAARIQNLVWNHTAIGPHVFQSHVRARDLFTIFLTNFILIVLTLGLFKPFADIRVARYRLSRMALNAQSGLEEFFAREQQAVNALGEETADVFDVDISF
jgi:uncharacterized membrane protein YjgN (DUF898 family)